MTETFDYLPILEPEARAPGPFGVPAVVAEVGFVCADPDAASLVALDATGTRWRLTWVRPMLDNAPLRALSTYEFVGSNGHAPATLAVDPEAVGSPTYVDITTEEHQDGLDYELRIHRLEPA